MSERHKKTVELLERMDVEWPKAWAVIREWLECTNDIIEMKNNVIDRQSELMLYQQRRIVGLEYYLELGEEE